MKGTEGEISGDSLFVKERGPVHDLPLGDGGLTGWGDREEVSAGMQLDNPVLDPADPGRFRERLAVQGSGEGALPSDYESDASGAPDQRLRGGFENLERLASIGGRYQQRGNKQGHEEREEGDLGKGRLHGATWFNAG